MKGTPCPPIFFVRHGETEWNAMCRFQGQTNVPLNAKGRAQAHGNGQRLKEYLSLLQCDFEALRVVASPLDRALETARIVCEELGVRPDIRVDSRLQEQFYGDWEGLLADEIRDRFPEEWAARGRNLWEFCPSGGESGAQMRARARKLLPELAPMTLVVGHFGSLCSLLSALCASFGRAAGKEEPSGFRVRQDSVYVYGQDGMREVCEAFPAGRLFRGK